MIFIFLYYFSTVILLFIFIICLGFYIYQKNSRFYTMILQIPGSKSLPVIGDALEWAVQEDPFSFVRHKAQTGKDILSARAFHLGGAGIFNLDDIEKLLSSNKFIKKGIFYNMLTPWLQTGLLTSTGEKWFHRRKILTPAFHFTILQNFVTIFNEETQKLLKVLEQNENDPNVEVFPIVSQYTLTSIAATAMGTSLEEEQDCQIYKESIHEMGKTFAYRALRPWCYNNFIYGLTPRGLQDQKRLKIVHEFTTNVIRNREKMLCKSVQDKPSKKLAMLDLLLSAKNQGENIDNEGIREEVDTFMFEGHDTTATAITFLLMLLANHQEIQERCYDEITTVLLDSNQSPTYSDLQEMSYIERCIKEALRLYPSVPHIFRTIEEDFESITGYIIPKGGDILIPIYDLHRRPDLYPDPEKFDPDRFLLENCKDRHPYAYIPFSAGPRNCIGQRFAILELKAVLCGILRKYRLEAVTCPKDLTFYLDMVLRSNNPIKIKFVPRLG